MNMKPPKIPDRFRGSEHPFGARPRNRTTKPTTVNLEFERLDFRKRYDPYMIQLRMPDEPARASAPPEPLVRMWYRGRLDWTPEAFDPLTGHGRPVLLAEGPPPTDFARVCFGGLNVTNVKLHGNWLHLAGSFSATPRPNDVRDGVYSIAWGIEHAPPSDGKVTSLARELPPGTSDAERVRMLRRAIIATFAHELDEFMRVDGVRVKNPHPEEGNRNGESFWLSDDETVTV